MPESLQGADVPMGPAPPPDDPMPDRGRSRAQVCLEAKWVPGH